MMPSRIELLNSFLNQNDEIPLNEHLSVRVIDTEIENKNIKVYCRIINTETYFCFVMYENKGYIPKLCSYSFKSKRVIKKNLIVKFNRTKFGFLNITEAKTIRTRDK